MSLLDSTDKIISERLADAKGDVIPLGNRAPRNFLKSAAILLIGIIFVLLVWWITSEYYNTYMIKTLRFPTPGETFDTLWYYLDSTHKLLRYTLYEHVAASMERWIKGFVLAFIIGMTLGILMGINDKIYKFGSVPVNILQMIPGLAWFPVTILLFGFGDKSAIFIIAVTVISPIAFNVAAGLRRVPQVNLRVARMSGIVIICVIGLVIDKLIFANVEKYARNKLGMEESS